MSAPPPVSIVTPAYNQAEFLEETLRSVQQQTYPYLEHIVIDDGSTDGTVELLRRYEGRYRLRWYSQTNVGQSATLNKGFQLATGEILAWLNSDDVYFSPTTVTEAVQVFQQQPTAGVVYGDYALIDPAGLVFRIIPARKRISLHRLVCYCLGQPSSFMRQGVIRAFPLRSDLRYRMDYELWLRMCTGGVQFHYVPRVWSAFRVHAGSNTVAAAEASSRELVQVQRQYFNGAWTSRWPLEPISRRSLGLWLRLRGMTRVHELYETPLAFHGRRLSRMALYTHQLFSGTLRSLERLTH